MTELSDSDVSRLLRLAGPRPAVPAEAATRVHDALRAHWERELSARRRRRWAARAALAASLAGLSFLVLTRHRAEPPKPAPTVGVLERAVGAGVSGGSGPLGVGAAVTEGSWLETPANGRAAVRMERGVSLRLDTDTRVQLLSSTTAWLDRGAVYVDSGDTASELGVQIQTREGQVRELGTQFQVRAGPGGVQVRVREGRVVLAGRHEVRAGSRLDLAGGQARLSHAPGQGPDWAWVEETAPEYVLEGQTLDAFLTWAARETGRRVRFRSEPLRRTAATTRLHGSTRGLTPSEALEAVLPASGLVGRYDGDVLWIAAPGNAAR